MADEHRFLVHSESPDGENFRDSYVRAADKATAEQIVVNLLAKIGDGYRIKSVKQTKG